MIEQLVGLRIGFVFGGDVLRVDQAVDLRFELLPTIFGQLAISDQLLGDHSERFPGEVDAAARADGIEQLGQGSL